MASHVSPAASRLLGLELNGKWKVVQLLTKAPQHLTNAPKHTGGHFSFQYVVEDGAGKRAFLKVLDFSGALQSPDPARALQTLTTDYNFERDLLELCAGRHMSRVVLVLDSGVVTVSPGNLGDQVPFLVFELADRDVRQHLDGATAIDASWKLRALHHAALGILQLHTAGIAHQDVKPSNLLVFETDACSKIGDLGRASSRATPSSADLLAVAGDKGYAPPELLYGYFDASWEKRRIGCDAYLFGSLMMFLFVGANANGPLYKILDPGYHFNRWRGQFRDVLPYLQRAFSDSLRQAEHDLPMAIRHELKQMLSELCNPDPQLRGPRRARDRIGSPLLMEYYISRLDALAREAEFSSKRGVR
jgi:eukaryotic-like serine/threonine-protein kinase